MSSGDGVERITPFSNSPIAFGACVFLATTKAISGSRRPTKTISPSRISRAAAATISSLSVYSAVGFELSAVDVDIQEFAKLLAADFQLEASSYKLLAC